MAETTDWSGFDTEAHRAAQAACRHLIHCAVDAPTRAAVSATLNSAQQAADGTAIIIMLAQLTGPCCLPPVNQATPTASAEAGQAATTSQDEPES